MQKFLLVWAMILPMTALANSSISAPDVVSDWHCVADSEYHSEKALMRYHADGTATEFMEIKEKVNHLPELEFSIMNYQWQLKDNKLLMSNPDITYYQYYFILPDGGFYKFDDEVNAEGRALMIESFEENNWHYIEFDGKDKHRYYFEDGYEGHCQRLK